MRKKLPKLHRCVIVQWKKETFRSRTIIAIHSLLVLEPWLWEPSANTAFGESAIYDQYTMNAQRYVHKYEYIQTALK